MVNDLKLVKPHPQYERSFRSGFDELTTPSDQYAWIYLGETAHDTYFKMTFKEYVETLLKREFSPPPNFVCDTVYWGLMGGEIVGRISIRHELNEFLKKAGGHIGYITRPSARNKGVAGEMLRQILATEKAKSLSSLLVTCDDGNIASEKTILRAGGVLENIIDLAPDKPRKKRFWFHLDNKKQEQESNELKRGQQ